MTIPGERAYPRDDRETVYLKHVIRDPRIEAGDYTFYNDFTRDPAEFEKNNVLYHYPINPEKLVIGKFCSIACGAKFLFTSANHAMRSLSTYPFPIFHEEWELPRERVVEAWDNKGDIVVGSDVWIGFEALILQGVTVSDGAIIGARAVVTKDVPPYAIVGGVPARVLRYRFEPDVVSALERLRWWDWPYETIRLHLTDIQSGNIEALKRLI